MTAPARPGFVYDLPWTFENDAEGVGIYAELDSFLGELELVEDAVPDDSTPAGHVIRLSPTVGRFVRSDADVVMIYGARGEGKSIGGVARILRIAHGLACQLRVAVVRDTWVNIERTVFETLRQGQLAGWWDVAFSNQSREALLDGGVAKLYFFGMDRAADANKFQGFEAGLLWLEEPAPAADISSGIPAEVFAMGVSSLRQPGVPRPTVQITMNPPDRSHWTLELQEVVDDAGHPDMRCEVFRIPTGENVHLPVGYRERMRLGLEAAQRPDLIRRLSEGNIGTVIVGVPVTPEFSDLHVAKAPIEIRLGWPTYRAYDAGLNPTCCPEDARITLSDGRVCRIRDIQVGDSVLAVYGDPPALAYPSRVVGAAQTGWKPCVEIRTRHQRIRVSDDHPVLVVEPTTRGWQRLGSGGTRTWTTRFKPARDIARGDLVAYVSRVYTPETPYSLPHVQAKTTGKGANQVVPLPSRRVDARLAELCGAWMGDGYFGGCGVRWAAYDARIVSRWSDLVASVLGRPARVYDKERGGVVAAESTDLRLGMRAAGLTGKSRTKRIPAWVYVLPLPERLAFLRGYLDSDGTVKRQGNVRFCSVNEDLIWDMWALCKTLGITTTAVATNRRGSGYATEPVPSFSFSSHDPMWTLIGSTKWPDRLKASGVRRSAGKIIPGLDTERVMWIRHGSVAEPVWNLEVEDAHTFLVNGVVTHNCLHAQTTPMGHLNIIGCVVGMNMGMEELLEVHVIPWEAKMNLRVIRPGPRPPRDQYGHLRAWSTARPMVRFRDIGDPACVQREQTHSERSVARVIENLLGTTFEKGRVEWAARLTSLRAVLTRNIGGRPMLQIDPECVPLIEALEGRWRYAKFPSGKVSLLPIKDLASHPGDSLSYLTSVLYPSDELTRRALAAPVPRVRPPASWAGR